MDKNPTRGGYFGLERFEHAPGATQLRIALDSDAHLLVPIMAGIGGATG
jgi:hypothetical protein